MLQLKMFYYRKKKIIFFFTIKIIFCQFFIKKMSFVPKIITRGAKYNLDTKQRNVRKIERKCFVVKIAKTPETLKRVSYKDSSSTIKSVRKYLEVLYKRPIRGLAFGGKWLKENKTLKFYNLTYKKKIIVFLPKDKEDSEKKIQ